MMVMMLVIVFWWCCCGGGDEVVMLVGRLSAGLRLVSTPVSWTKLLPFPLNLQSAQSKYSI